MEWITIAIAFALPPYLAFKWARQEGRWVWPWTLACMVFSYFGLLAFVLTRKGLPTVSEYARKYPACVTERGMSCYRCGSRSIRLWREQPFIAVHQWHICNSCGTSLYRSR